MVDPDLQLSPQERSELAMLFRSKGWAVLVKLLRAIVEQFRVDLDNADHSNPKDAMAKHSLSRSAGMVVTLILTRIAQEASLQQAISAQEGTAGNPEVSAPGLEMDNIAEAVKDLPNLLGDVTYIAEDDDEK